MNTNTAFNELNSAWEHLWMHMKERKCWKPNWQYETAAILKCLTFHHTQCDRAWLIETCLSERKERKRRISKETANTGVALYQLGRWGVITANFNQFRSIIHGQGPSELISKMPLPSLSLTALYELFRLHLHKELHLWYLISQLETLCNRECQLEMGKWVSWYVHNKKENKATRRITHTMKSLEPQTSRPWEIIIHRERSSQL